VVVVTSPFFMFVGHSVAALFVAITTSTFAAGLYEAYNSLLYISSFSLSLLCAIVYTHPQLGVSTFLGDSSLLGPDDTVLSRA
jgi:small basic protein